MVDFSHSRRWDFDFAAALNEARQWSAERNAADERRVGMQMQTARSRQHAQRPTIWETLIPVAGLLVGAGVFACMGRWTAMTLCVSIGVPVALLRTARVHRMERQLV